MRILYDSIYIADRQRIGGVSRYFSEIIPRIRRDHEPLLGFSQTKNVYFQKMGIPEYRKNFLERRNHQTKIIVSVKTVITAEAK